MDAIRITDLPLVSEYELRDKIHLQRLEAGIWNDYHTDIGSYLGEFKTAVFTWDMSGDFADYIPCPVGKYLIILSATFAYKPGSGNTGIGAQILLWPDASSWSWASDFMHDGTGQGGSVIPAFGSGSGANIYGEVDSGVNVTGSMAPSFPNYGTCRIQVNYVEFTPL